MIIDSHCHLDKYYESKEDIEGVDYCLGISCDGQELDKFIQFLDKTHNVYGAIGIHPEYADSYDINDIEKRLKHNKIVGYGEIGLDYHYENASREEQIKALEEQLDLANRYKLPIIIHNRESDEDMISILNNFKLAEGGLLHCYSSSEKLWEYGLNRGLYISFSGMVTFKKLSHVQELAKNTPLSSILIETDSPYLSPEPYRGKENHPKMVKFVGEKIALLKSITPEEVFQASSDNFFNLFKKARRENI